VSALENLCDIGDSMCRSQETISKECRKAFAYDGTLRDALVNVVNVVDGLSGEECERMCGVRVSVHKKDGGGEETMVERVERLKRLADSYAILEGLGEVFERLIGLEDYDEEGDEEDGEEEEEGG